MDSVFLAFCPLSRLILPNACRDGNGYGPSLFRVQWIQNSSVSHSQSYNSQGLNPCQIAGSLQAPCLGYCALATPLPLRNPLFIEIPNSRLHAWTTRVRYKLPYSPEKRYFGKDLRLQYYHLYLVRCLYCLPVQLFLHAAHVSTLNYPTRRY